MRDRSQCSVVGCATLITIDIVGLICGILGVVLYLMEEHKILNYRAAVCLVTGISTASRHRSGSSYFWSPKWRVRFRTLSGVMVDSTITYLDGFHSYRTPSLAETAAQEHPLGSNNTCWYDTASKTSIDDVQWEKPDASGWTLMAKIGFSLFTLLSIGLILCCTACCKKGENLTSSSQSPLLTTFQPYEQGYASSVSTPSKEKPFLTTKPDEDTHVSHALNHGHFQEQFFSPDAPD